MAITGSAQSLQTLLAQAVTALQSGRFDDARKLAENALRLGPRNAACHLIMGTALQNLNLQEEAERSYRECLRIDRRNLRALINIGMLFINTERAEEAIKALERSLSIDANALEARHYLARAYGMCGRYDEAIAQFRRVLQKVPNEVEVLKGLGKTLAAAQQFGDAVETFERVHKIDPSDPVVCREIGTNCAILGDFDKAETWLRKAIQISPYATDAYYQLSSIRRLTTEDAEALEAHLSSLDPEERKEHARIYFALGSFHDRNGEAERAFEAYAQANAITDEQFDYNADRWRKHYARLREVTDQELLASLPHGSDSEKPVFIVGMPRSGTTLVETMLAGHPAVYAAGERMAMRQAEETLAARKPDAPLDIRNIDKASLKKRARTYLEELPGEARDAMRVTDKLPGNTAYLPLIARMFSNARIIVCRRHPMDIVWSIFKSGFTSPVAFATNLDNIAAEMAVVSDYMDAWVEAMPEQTLEVIYEELVNDFEAGARRIVSFCGLEWDDACLHPEAVERTVQTVSIWQVRQPVSASSIGQWRKYETQLSGVRETLAPLVEAYESRLQGLGLAQD